MFRNIGNKIKIAARIAALVEIIFCVVFGFVLLVSVESMALTGFLIMTVGSLISWLSSLILYGFGELVENSMILAGKKNADETDPNAKNKTLEKWRNEGLITEEEYAAKINGAK